MNLSPPTPVRTISPSARKTQHDATAVIENDWVPAIQVSAMNQATPVRLAGPLRPMWYVGNAKRLLSKVVRSKRQTV